MINESNVWVISDKENNLWQVFLNDKNELVYNIMYGDDKWTKEKRLDKEVSEFFLDVDSGYNIHVVYRDSAKIKYCIWNGKQWLGKIIYESEVGEYIENIKILATNNNVNVFFISGNYEKQNKEIIHYRFDNVKGEFKNVCKINRFTSTPYYSLEVLEKNNINLILLESEEEKKVVSKIVFNNEWGKKESLYYLEGENIKIITLTFNNSIYVLNLSQNNRISYLEEVNISSSGQMSYTKIYETKNSIEKMILLNREKYIELLWQEEESILQCNFEKKWSEVKNIFKDEKFDLTLYNSKCISLRNEIIISHKIIGSNYPKIRFLLTNNNEDEEFNIDYLNKISKNDTSINFDEKYENKKVKENNLKSNDKVIKELNKKIANLMLQLQKSEDNYEKIRENYEILQIKNKHKEKNLLEFKSIFEEVATEKENLKKNIEKEILEKGNLKEDRDNLMNEKNRLSEENERLKEDRDSLINEKNKSSEEKEKFKNKIEHLEKELYIKEKENEEKIKKLDMDKKLLEEKILKNKTEFSREKRMINEECQNLKSLLKNKEQLYVNLEKIYEDTKIKYDAIKIQLDEKSNKHKEIEILLSDREDEMKIMKLGEEENKAKVNELLYENEILRTEIEGAHDTINLLSDEKEKLRSELEEEFNRSFISRIWNKRGGD